MTRLTWEPGQYAGWTGRAGKVELFSITWITTGRERLATRLPIGSSALKEYATDDEAKAAAERILASFLKEIGA